MTALGRLVLVNGASSSGKTSIAAGFRDLRAADGEYWMLIGIDDFLSKLPVEWLDVGLPGGAGAHAADGLSLDVSGDVPVLRMGRVCRDLLCSYRAAVADAVRRGVNVIVDEVVIDETCWDDWLSAVGDLDPVWVGVRCDEAVAVERETARGDRAVGMTRSQTDTVHRFPTYAFEIDTTNTTPAEALAEFCRQLRI